MYTSVLVITSQHLCDVSLCYMQSDVWDTYSYFSSVAGLSSPIPISLGHIVLPFDLPAGTLHWRHQAVHM